jgi:uncharacterized LabA/DUF88 family protein
MELQKQYNNPQDLKRDYYLFSPSPYGRIFVLVDFSNVRHWAKSFWPEDNKNRIKREIDIKKLADVINWVSPEEKRFYYGYWKENLELSKDNEINVKHRNSWFRIDKAVKNGFIPRSKEIKEIPIFDDGGKFNGYSPKCNFDVEITLDAITQMPKYDTLFLWTGDSDFDELLRYLKSKGKKIITICSRDFASNELENNSTLFIPADPLKDFLEFIPYKTDTPSLRREV